MSALLTEKWKEIRLMEMVDLNLDVALKILKAAGHQIGDAYIPPAPHGDAMRIWIDGVPCTLRGILRMAEVVIEAKGEEKPEQPR
jgi:hypothetical protein